MMCHYYLSPICVSVPNLCNCNGENDQSHQTPACCDRHTWSTVPQFYNAQMIFYFRYYCFQTVCKDLLGFFCTGAKLLIEVLHGKFTIEYTPILHTNFVSAR